MEADGVTIYGAVLFAGFIALSVSVALLALRRAGTEGEERAIEGSWWFYASVLSAGLGGLGLGGVVASFAALGVALQAVVVVLAALSLGTIAHGLIRPLLRGEALLD